MKYFQTLVIICTLSMAGKTYAQKVETGQEFLEIAKIADVYAHVTGMSFTISFSYADSVAPLVILDSSSVFYQLSSGKIFMINNEMEVLHAGNYAIYLDKIDSNINVNNTSPPQQVIQLPFMDSIFRVAHVAGMRVTEINNSMRQLSIFFNPGSFYHGYQMLYDTNTALIKQIKYYTESNGMYDMAANSVLGITINFSNYQFSIPDQALFNENRYIYILNNAVYLQPAYHSFNLQTKITK